MQRCCDLIRAAHYISLGKCKKNSCFFFSNTTFRSCFDTARKEKERGGGVRGMAFLWHLPPPPPMRGHLKVIYWTCSAFRPPFCLCYVCERDRARQNGNANTEKQKVFGWETFGRKCEFGKRFERAHWRRGKTHLKRVEGAQVVVSPEIGLRIGGRTIVKRANIAHMQRGEKSGRGGFSGDNSL